MINTNNENSSDIQLEVNNPPWFCTYNNTMASENSTTVYPLFPWKAENFCALSPWEDHVILAHDGIEPFSKKAGFTTPEAYLLSLIEASPKRGEFCKKCRNQYCATAD
jgi:hypothetical protein